MHVLMNSLKPNLNIDLDGSEVKNLAKKDSTEIKTYHKSLLKVQLITLSIGCIPHYL